jgi:hypothetical protein
VVGAAVCPYNPGCLVSGALEQRPIRLWSVPRQLGRTNLQHSSGSWISQRGEVEIRLAKPVAMAEMVETAGIAELSR